MNPPNPFIDRYSSLCDEDLLRLTLDMKSLVPLARESLRSELERRHLPVESIDWAAQPVTPSDRSALGIAPQAGSTVPANVLEERAVNAACRYREGYLHARAIDGFGATIKAIALAVGGLLAFVGVVTCANSSNTIGGIGGIGGIALFLAGLLLGGFGYILGVLVQSAGQSMKAHFDCAVNGSHFLNDAQRAKVMSLE